MLEVDGEDGVLERAQTEDAVDVAAVALAEIAGLLNDLLAGIDGNSFCAELKRLQLHRVGLHLPHEVAKRHLSRRRADVDRRAYDDRAAEAGIEHERDGTSVYDGVDHDRVFGVVERNFDRARLGGKGEESGKQGHRVSIYFTPGCSASFHARKTDKSQRAVHAGPLGDR